VAVNDYSSTNEDTPVTIPVKMNDSDPDGDKQGPPTIISQPKNGSASVNPDGTITYTPKKDFYGIDSFPYFLCDDGMPTSKCDTAMVYVTVEKQNDKPNLEPVTATTTTGQPIGLNLSAGSSDPNGDPLTFIPINKKVTGGTVIVNPDGSSTIIPDSGYTGPITFTYIACDVTVIKLQPLCDTETVTVNVVALNSTLPPYANVDRATTPLNTPVTLNILANDGSPNMPNDKLTPTITQQGKNGTATIGPDGKMVYTPNNGFKGVDTVYYKLCDTSLPVQCVNTMAIIDVTGDVEAVPNNKVVAVDDYYSTNEDTPITFDVKLNDSDPDGDAIGPVTQLSTTSNGKLVHNPDGTFTYTPNPDFYGKDSFRYYICDNGTPSKCDTAWAFITVKPVNDKPVCNDDYYKTKFNTTLPVPVTGILINDKDKETGLAVDTTPVAKPKNGSVKLNPDGSFTYVPNPTFSGKDTFFYVACDSGIPLPKQCDTAMVVITIEPEIVIKTNDDYRIISNLDTALVIKIGGNDTLSRKPDTIMIQTPPKNGTVTVNPDGTITYKPIGLPKPDTFVYIVKIGDKYDTSTVYILPNNTSTVPNIWVPDAMTPNGDGINDTWVIGDLVNFPAATVTIYNRWGDEVFHSNGVYQNDFAGQSVDGEILPDATYYYVINFHEPMVQNIAGFLTVRR
jgi:gliding motility-associated-like protein